MRNVANLVPPYNPDHEHHGTSAAIEYAVTSLRVAHIVVLGHAHCGGVEACHDMCAGDAPELEEQTSFVGRWMDILRPAYEKIRGLESDRTGRLTQMEEEASSFVGRWMDILRPTYEKCAASLPTERQARLRAFEKSAVLASLDNLSSFPFVSAAVDRGALTLHGAWIDIADGRLHIYDAESGDFAPI